MEQYNNSLIEDIFISGFIEILCYCSLPLPDIRLPLLRVALLLARAQPRISFSDDLKVIFFALRLRCLIRILVNRAGHQVCFKTAFWNPAAG